MTNQMAQTDKEKDISVFLKGVQLKKWVIEKLVTTEHRRTRLALMDLLEKGEVTIARYCHANHPLLCKPYSLELLCAYFRCEPDMLTEPRPAPKMGPEVIED